MKYEVDGCIVAQGSEKAATPHYHFEKVALKRCQGLYNVVGAMSPQNPTVGLLSGVHRFYLFGTSLLSFNFEGGNGIGFFAPQGMLVNS